jgi:hypothetical protein
MQDLPNKRLMLSNARLEMVPIASLYGHQKHRLRGRCWWKNSIVEL